MTREQLVKKGLAAKRESKYVEFKEECSPDSAYSWCVLVKEIVAFANTAGGVIIVGLDNQGVPSGADVSDIRKTDAAVFTDKIARYTGQQFTSFELTDCSKDGRDLLAIVVDRAHLPMVFEKPGTYAVSKKEQRTVFSQGTVYFRHGSKSEPGTSEDLRKALERRIAEIRDEWLGGIRKVVYAEPGSEIAVLPREVIQTDLPGAPPIRLSDDPEAPVYRLESPDTAYPYRQSDLIEELNERLPKGTEVNQYDILSVRRVYSVNEESRFSYNPKYGSPQYSESLVEWIIGKHAEDPQFFSQARDSYYQMTHDQ